MARTLLYRAIKGGEFMTHSIQRVLEISRQQDGHEQIMRKVFMVREDDELNSLSERSGEDIKAALSHRDPSLSKRIADEEIVQLHDFLILLRSGLLSSKRGKDELGKFLIVEMNENGVAMNLAS